jgi:hypothetical protein
MTVIEIKEIHKLRETPFENKQKKTNKQQTLINRKMKKKRERDIRKRGTDDTEKRECQKTTTVFPSPLP